MTWLSATQHVSDGDFNRIALVGVCYRLNVGCGVSRKNDDFRGTRTRSDAIGVLVFGAWYEVLVTIRHS
jgi:hypothetical protein